MPSEQIVAYYRVSTDRQGRSGLGLDAQRDAIARLLNAGGRELIGEFTEVETGKGADALERRPQLKAALEMAKRCRATLVIAKLDRLSRNVAFISSLMETGVPVVPAETPQITTFELHIRAALAQEERRLISDRTTAALAAAKARGVTLGSNGRMLAAQRKAEALERLHPCAERLTSLRSEGLSIKRIAERLNAERVPSPGGGAWHPSNTHRALARLRDADTASLLRD